MVIPSNHPKKTKGRQKIEIKPIQEKSNLQVTFSKRRGGLIKKASELSLLCGARVAFITFSPGNKVFTYGHPNVDSVIDHYLNQTTPHDQSENGAIQQWNAEYVKAMKDLEDEKNKSLAMISENNNTNPNLGGSWWENNSIINDDSVGLEELEDYLMRLKELKRNVDNRIHELMFINANNNHHLFGFNYHHVDNVFQFGQAN